MRRLTVKFAAAFAILACLTLSLSAQTAVDWDISATASSITEWTQNTVFEDVLDINTRVLSTREDGCFIDAGSRHGVAVGQVYEIYRSSHSGDSEETIGEVQVAWTRNEYSFAEPRAGLDVNSITTLHFARLIETQPSVALISDISEGYIGNDLDRLLQAIYGLMSVRRNINPILGPARERTWRVVIMPDFEGTTIRAQITDPGGEIFGTLTLDPSTGQRPPERITLDPFYLTDMQFPFINSLAPPGRRSVKIACGNITPDTVEELAILNGRNLWVYDLSLAEPRLVTSLTVSIPPGTVRHREDTGSLVLVDLDGDGQDEVCLAPPGGKYGEIWRLDGDNWVQLEFLEHPPHAADAETGGVLIAPWRLTSPSLDNGLAKWVYPLSDEDDLTLRLSNTVAGTAVVPGTGGEFTELVLSDPSGRLYHQTRETGGRFLDGTWGSPVAIAMVEKNPVVIATSTSITSDVLTIFELHSGDTLALYPILAGPIIDIAVGDIDRDRKAEIIIAVLEEDGVKIYY